MLVLPDLMSAMKKFRFLTFSVALMLGQISTAVAQDVTFTDVTVSAGVDYIQHNHEMAPTSNLQVYVTGGAAAADFDNDGYVDLFVTRLDDSDILFRNNGDGTFSDVTSQAFPPFDLSFQSNGAQWGDIDNDGDQDLYVTSIESTRYHLFINDGNGQFTESATQRSADLAGQDLHFGFSATFGDYDLDGYLDLHTTEWRQDFQVEKGTPFNARLLRNAGASNPGHFIDVTDLAGVNMESVPYTNPSQVDFFEAQSFSNRFTDLDADGYPGFGDRFGSWHQPFVLEQSRRDIHRWNGSWKHWNRFFRNGFLSRRL